MSGQLFVQLQGETVKMLALDMNLLSIGRTPDNGLALPHPSVAIRHAEVRRLQDQVIITDLGAGDTFLSGKRLTPHQPQVLDDGAVLQVGPYVITYTLVQHVPASLHSADPLPPESLDDLRFVPLQPPRARYPALPAEGAASSYLSYLPALFTESDFAGRLLQIFENVWEPLQHRQDFVDMYFDPATCPEPFLNWFAEWMGLSVDPHWPESRRRQWLREAINLQRWRGTRYGLMRMLEICCGVTPRVVEDPHRPYHLLFVLPDPAGEQDVTRENIEQVIAQHVPAHVMYEVRYV
ncbi:phage tail protein I [Deinococcus peraridilitoris]|uniref:Phage tail protein, P2 protein I family n=1 Tax=Deinococcus peraridilitoris (strain DSM 19664 / LMG 22246 / CIP 109416 / KR-200) TaxID=937777 RepID=L0A0I0_DEIPD|nr:phage tail protein I [Deinococcus peraridilitoris]AFZ67351.1 phage tail protein, P2 protein I family [Deinococcus peraridilitoris DSM 19664]